MRRRTFLQAAAPALAAAPRQERPNVLFVISDDQPWIHTGLDTGAAIRTPA